MFALSRRFFLAPLVALAALGLSPHAQAQAVDVPSGNYANDPAHTSVTWKVNHFGLSNYTARFTKVDAQLTLDAANPENSKLFVAIDPRSVRTDFPEPTKKDFDKELGTGGDWFNGDKFPQIVFRATSLKRTSATTGTMTGDLTFLGVTKPMTFNVTLNGSFKEHPYTKKGAIGFSATATIKRSDWGLNTYLPNLGDNVQILVESEFNQK